MAKFELHISDVRTFKSCRRRWDWSSPLRRHLEPIVTPVYFLLGRAVHLAIANFYETGEIPEDTYRRFMAKAVKEYEGQTGPLWPEEREKLDTADALGLGLCQHYFKWVTGPEEPDARWETVATEMQFSVPIPTPSGTPSSRIFLAGRFDGVVRDRVANQLWLREYKTSARTPDERWLSMDDQATIYCWAAQQVLGEPITGIHYRFLIKKIPEYPRELKNGELSRAINSSLATTYNIYREALELHAKKLTRFKYKIDETQTPESAGVDPTAFEGYRDKTLTALLTEYGGILDELSTRGSGDFFKEFEVRKTQAELISAAHDLWIAGLEMCRETTPLYPAPDWLKCTFCPFKSPCQAKNAGADAEVILRYEYRKRVEEDPVDAVVLKIQGDT